MALEDLLAAAQLKNFPAGSVPEATHTAMGDPIFGAFSIPEGSLEAKAFHEAYIKSLEAGRPLSIVEAHTDISPVIVDLDMRQTSPERIYTEQHVSNFVDALLSATKHFVDQQCMEVVVLEKPTPRPAKNAKGKPLLLNGAPLYKDGIHVVMPNVVTHPEIQLAIREHFTKATENTLRKQ